MTVTGVYVGDILLRADDTGWVDAFGVRWTLGKLDGWFDGWEGSGQVDQRSQADGAWVSPQYATARVIHLAGTADATDWDAATLAWDRLLGQLPFRELATLRVSTGVGAVGEQTALVRQHEKPVTDRVNGIISFSLSLVAPDPRRYDSSSRSAALVLPILSGGIAPPLTPPFTITGSTSVSQATLTNDGNVVTYPMLVVAGPCPPCTIANLTTGEILRVLDTVPADQTLVIDVHNGTATTGGQARRVLGSWWGLRPGDNEISFRADGYEADAQLLISFRSAWK